VITVGKTVSPNVITKEVVAVVLYESVTVNVIVALPDWFAAGVTTTVLEPPVPETTILAFGTTVVLDEVAVTTKLDNGVFSSFTVNAIALLGVFGQSIAGFEMALIIGTKLAITVMV